MAKHTYRWSNGLEFFEKQDIKMCEKMAVKGWQLVGVNKLGFYKFKRTEPEVVSYVVDLSDIKIASPEFESYREIFESSGWEYACSYGTFHYFRAPKGANLTPIYTDSATLAEKHKRTLRICAVWTLSGLAVTAPFLALSVVPSETLDDFAKSHQTITMIISGLGGGALGLAIAGGFGAVLNAVRMVRAKKRVTSK